MPDTTRTHWTSDEELLEQFVQGRISTERRKSLEEHLKGCAQCRAHVDEERMLSLGVRAAGRADLRRDLADRLSRRSTPDASGVWRWMAAAAVLVAAVGIWRLLTPGVPLSSEHETPPMVAEEPKQPPSETAGRSEPVSSPSRASERPGRLGRAERSEIAQPQDEPLAAPPAAGAAVTIAEAPLEAKADAVERDADAKEAIGEEPKVSVLGETWVEATLLSPPVQNAQKIARAPIDQRAKDAEAKVQTAGQAVSAGGPMPMQLRQVHRSELPAEQRRPSAMASREIVPARISVIGDSLLIELFPPTPYAEEDLKKALIMRPRLDSVVVMVGRHFLGMRIPESFLAR